MTRWLVTGSTGMLGHDLTGLLTAEEAEFTGLTRGDLDVTDASAVTAAVASLKPDVVVNCAAWTEVDDAETDEDAALAVNGHGAANIAAACAAVGAILVQLSTDYVFDGHASAPYAEDAVPAPRTAYGRTKLAGEQAVLDTLPGASYIVRTAWLYGAHGPNFVRTMLRLARSGTAPGVVDDQRGQPTWTMDVATAIYALIDAAAPTGVYHATSSGETTWFGFAEEIFALYNASLEADQSHDTERQRLTPRPVTTADFPRPAPRPTYSVLGHDAWKTAGVTPIGHWRDALHRAFPALS
jgi:dTDP-4-dehydrorhamnose reductase